MEVTENFQLTTSRRGRRPWAVHPEDIFPFNSRPHAEVDSPLHLQSFSAFPPFNSRPHAEVDRANLINDGAYNPFNSRPHAEVDPVHCDNPCRAVLSTHDLTQRSTLLAFTPPTWYNLSTHDLTQRSTRQQEHAGSGEPLSTHDLTQRSTIPRDI